MWSEWEIDGWGTPPTKVSVLCKKKSKRNEIEQNKLNRKEIYGLSAKLPETLNTFYFTLSKINVLLAVLHV